MIIGMFTGIIRELSTLFSIDKGKYTFSKGPYTQSLNIGDSVAVNGCCLTCIELQKDSWSAEVVPETLSKTNLGTMKPQDRINCERPVKMQDALDGHLVQGHVDGVGTILKKELLPDRSYLLEISAPASVLKYLIPKGSIAVDGVSLTIVTVCENGFTIALIPHTAENTTLGFKQVGHTVNLEADLIAKYVEKYASCATSLS